jgi:Lon protease-like protein
MGVGRIVQWERMATGRYNLLLQGECRARIDRELPADTLYRMVTATPLEDEGADTPAVAPLTSRVRSAAARILATVGRSGEELQQSLDALTEPGRLCDQIASTLIPSPATRQALLEELHVERRLERLAVALDDLRSHLREEGGR